MGSCGLVLQHASAAFFKIPGNWVSMSLRIMDVLVSMDLLVMNWGDGTISRESREMSSWTIGVEMRSFCLGVRGVKSSMKESILLEVFWCF